MRHRKRRLGGKRDRGKDRRRRALGRSVERESTKGKDGRQKKRRYDGKG